ncbi:MAG TPA: hypothetical protein VM736_15355 [Gemmatimonadales bacterium]|nr:hypothetical protein [Gemmatimonadales bacterium]
MRCTSFAPIAVVTGALAACEPLPTAAPQRTASPPPLFARAHATPSGVGLVPCAPLHDATVHNIVGPEGATIEIGPHRVVIPPGALRRTYKVEAKFDGDLAQHTKLVKLPTGRTVKVGYTVVNAVQFAPHLRFARPTTITLSFANCDVQALEAASVKVVYTNHVLNVVHKVLPSTVHPADATVTAELEHFSNYAVAW